ncbi:MAG TPA: PorV/PorQ family protein [bacterium]|nr:PorV/PorQ family protein [bacterium]
MRKIILIVCLLLLRTTVFAGDGYQFLRVGVTARATGLGDVFVAQPGDATTFMYNPAGLATLQGRTFAASYMNHILDIGSGFASYVQPLPRWGGNIGVGITYFTYGEFEGYDANGAATSSFHANDMAWHVFYARMLDEHVSVGGTFKYIRSTIDEFTSSAWAMDAGVQYLPEERVRLGIVLLNAGFVSDPFIRHKESLPLSLQAGVNYKLRNAPVTVNLTFTDIQNDLIKSPVVGAEWMLHESWSVRLGYSLQRDRELHAGSSDFLDRMAGASAGIGFKYDKYIVDYSFASWGIGTLNRFSIQYQF